MALITFETIPSKSQTGVDSNGKVSWWGQGHIAEVTSGIKPAGIRGIVEKEVFWSLCARSGMGSHPLLPYFSRWVEANDFEMWAGAGVRQLDGELIPSSVEMYADDLAFPHISRRLELAQLVDGIRCEFTFSTVEFLPEKELFVQWFGSETEYEPWSGLASSSDLLYSYSGGLSFRSDLTNQGGAGVEPGIRRGLLRFIRKS